MTPNAKRLPTKSDVSHPIDQPFETPVPGSNGVFVALLVRPLGTSFSEAGLPAGSKTVSVFLVNHRRPEVNDRLKDLAFAFQVRLELKAEVPFLARPDIRGLFTNDWDDEVADLQYRDCGEYSVGHNLSTEACLDDRVHRLGIAHAFGDERDGLAPQRMLQAVGHETR